MEKLLPGLRCPAVT